MEKCAKCDEWKKKNEIPSWNHSFTLTWLRKMCVDKLENVLVTFLIKTSMCVYEWNLRNKCMHCRGWRWWLRVAIGFLFDYTQSGCVAVKNWNFPVHFPNDGIDFQLSKDPTKKKSRRRVQMNNEWQDRKNSLIHINIDFRRLPVTISIISSAETLPISDSEIVDRPELILKLCHVVSVN